MNALNTTQGHSRVNGDNVVYLHRGHTHELVPHCTPQEQEPGPTLLDDAKSIAGLVLVIGIVGMAITSW